MGLFKSQDEKAQEKLSKQEQLLEKYGLETLTGKDAESVKEIADELIGSKVMEIGARLNFATKNEDLLKIGYLRAIYEQNWIIIRQLDKLNKK